MVHLTKTFLNLAHGPLSAGARRGEHTVTRIPTTHHHPQLQQDPNITHTTNSHC